MIAALVICGPIGQRTPHDGRYVVAWNSNVPYGDLALTSSPDIRQAKLFSGLSEMMAEYSAVSKVQPRRPDGQPNRPLRAMTIEIVNLQEVA